MNSFVCHPSFANNLPSPKSSPLPITLPFMWEPGGFDSFSRDYIKMWHLFCRSASTRWNQHHPRKPPNSSGGSRSIPEVSRPRWSYPKNVEWSWRSTGKDRWNIWIETGIRTRLWKGWNLSRPSGTRARDRLWSVTGSRKLWWCWMITVRRWFTGSPDASGGSAGLGCWGTGIWWSAIGRTAGSGSTPLPVRSW